MPHTTPTSPWTRMHPDRSQWRPSSACAGAGTAGQGPRQPSWTPWTASCTCTWAWRGRSSPTPSLWAPLAAARKPVPELLRCHDTRARLCVGMCCPARLTLCAMHGLTAQQAGLLLPPTQQFQKSLLSSASMCRHGAGLSTQPRQTMLLAGRAPRSPHVAPSQQR